MPELFCNKSKTAKGYALVPAHKTDEEALIGLPTGQPLKVKITRMRNVGMHRKYFALLKYAFDCWEPPELKEVELAYGQMPEKSRDEFRKNITILAGFRKVVFDINGHCHYRAKSISFPNMSQDEFEELYTKTIDVIIKRVLNNYTGDELRSVIDQIQDFE